MRRTSYQQKQDWKERHNPWFRGEDMRKKILFLFFCCSPAKFTIIIRIIAKRHNWLWKEAERRLVMMRGRGSEGESEESRQTTRPGCPIMFHVLNMPTKKERHEHVSSNNMRINKASKKEVLSYNMICITLIHCREFTSERHTLRHDHHRCTPLPLPPHISPNTIISHDWRPSHMTRSIKPMEKWSW